MHRASRPTEAGFSLTEMLATLLVVSIVAGGTMKAFVTAADIERAQNGPAMAEAVGYGRQFLEELRNHVADDDTWFATASTSGWQTAVFTDPIIGSQSIRLSSAIRKYCVTAQDCDGDGVTGDCYAVRVKICWAGTACPADGIACP